MPGLESGMSHSESSNMVSFLRDQSCNSRNCVMWLCRTLTRDSPRINEITATLVSACWKVTNIFNRFCRRLTDLRPEIRAENLMAFVRIDMAFLLSNFRPDCTNIILSLSENLSMYLFYLHFLIYKKGCIFKLKVKLLNTLDAIRS